MPNHFETWQIAAMSAAICQRITQCIFVYLKQESTEMKAKGGHFPPH